MRFRARLIELSTPLWIRVPTRPKLAELNLVALGKWSAKHGTVGDAGARAVKVMHSRHPALLTKLLGATTNSVESLVKRMVEKEPEPRPSATRARDHDWFKGIDRASGPDNTVASPSTPIPELHVTHDGTRNAGRSPDLLSRVRQCMLTGTMIVSP